MHVLNYHHSTLSFDALGEDDKFKYQCVNTLEYSLLIFAINTYISQHEYPYLLSSHHFLSFFQFQHSLIMTHSPPHTPHTTSSIDTIGLCKLLLRDFDISSNNSGNAITHKSTSGNFSSGFKHLISRKRLSAFLSMQ